MTCVWRRQPGSRSARLRQTALAGLLALLGFAAVASAAQLGPPLALRAPDAGRAERQRLEDWTTGDRIWLRTLPAANLALNQAGSDTSLVRVRRALLAGGAAADSLVSRRSAASLLRDRWLERGYLEAAVTVRGDSLLVAPGAPWQVGRWDLGGDDFPGRKRLVTTWLPQSGAAFRAADLERGIAQVLAGTGEAGFPFARWVTRSLDLDPEAREVHVTALLLTGNRAWLGPITSTLEDLRAQRFLARAAGLATGDPFRDSDLRRATDRLLARDLYTSVGEPQVYLTSAGDTVGVHFPVVARRKINRVQVVLGLSRREEGGSRLSGEVDLNLPNLAGSGRALQVGWRDDGQDKRRFGFRYLEPLSFGTGLDMGLALDNEVERESYTRFRLDNTWGLPVVALWGVELGLGWDRTTYPAGTLERSSRLRTSGAVQHRRGDRTRSGWEGHFAVETAWRSSLRPAEGEAVVPGGGLAEAVIQRIVRADVGGELWLGSTLSVFGRSSFRQLAGGDRNVPLAEQFRFGGAATLRGYREDEFRGSQAAWGALELRIGRPEGSRLYTFYDLGYFEFFTTDPAATDSAELVRRQGWPRGYGLGIFARTPGGDISLAIGFPGTVDFEQAKLHVTLLESF